MADKARRLNEEGLAAFEQHIRELREGKKYETPVHLLTDDRYSEHLQFDVEVDQQEFSTRYDLGIYLKEVLPENEAQTLLGDRGFWSWLALYWFDQLCPLQANGSRKPSQPYNYILSPNYNHRPRHALMTTWMLVSRHGANAYFLLSKKPHERGELIEQLAARQYLINCRGVIEAASRLYFDSKRKTFKRGSTSQKRKGNIRRFVVYLQQLDLTYDLGSITGDMLVSLLPDEYSAFLN